MRKGRVISMEAYRQSKEVAPDGAVFDTLRTTMQASDSEQQGMTPQEEELADLYTTYSIRDAQFLDVLATLREAGTITGRDQLNIFVWVHSARLHNQPIAMEVRSRFVDPNALYTKDFDERLNASGVPEDILRYLKKVLYKIS